MSWPIPNRPGVISQILPVPARIVEPVRRVSKRLLVLIVNKVGGASPNVSHACIPGAWLVYQPGSCTTCGRERLLL